jgi:hypothetical protein
MLDYIFSGKVRLQDFISRQFLSGTSDAGVSSVWQYLKDNHQKLHGKPSPVRCGDLRLSSRGLTTQKEADEVERY